MRGLEERVSSIAESDLSSTLPSLSVRDRGVKPGPACTSQCTCVLQQFCLQSQVVTHINSSNKTCILSQRQVCTTLSSSLYQRITAFTMGNDQRFLYIRA